MRRNIAIGQRLIKTYFNDGTIIATYMYHYNRPTDFTEQEAWKRAGKRHREMVKLYLASLPITIDNFDLLGRCKVKPVSRNGYIKYRSYNAFIRRDSNHYITIPEDEKEQQHT